MPNWKTYESSVRLLSAIMAAHPDLKLNYEVIRFIAFIFDASKEISKYYGDGVKYNAIWKRMNQIKGDAQLLRSAIDAGISPSIIGVTESKARAISCRFGGDCTRSAIENRFRRLKADAKIINESLKLNIDPITINVGDTKGEVAVKGKELARCFGSDVTPHALRCFFSSRLKANTKLIHEALRAGGDCKDILFDGAVERNIKSKAEIAMRFGSDCTPAGLGFQISSRIRPLGKRQTEFFKAGKDPKDIDLNCGSKPIKTRTETARFMGSDCTPKAISHHMADKAKPLGQRMKAMIDAGLDPKNVDLSGKTKKGGNEIATHFDSEITTMSIRLRFCRQIRPIAKRQASLKAAGQNPRDVDLSDYRIDLVNEIARHYGTDCTPGGVCWQFRCHKARGKLQAAALSLGGDPKDVDFGLNSKGGLDAKPKGATSEKNGNGTSASPSKGTPQKRPLAAAVTTPTTPSVPRDNVYQDTEENEDGDDTYSPVKKTPSGHKRAAPSALNKTLGGRINKPNAPPNRSFNTPSFDHVIKAEGYSDFTQSDGTDIGSSFAGSSFPMASSFADTTQSAHGFDQGMGVDPYYQPHQIEDDDYAA